MEHYQLRAPNGKLIKGTLEKLVGVAQVVYFYDEDGHPAPEYEGSTHIWWDEQHTIIRDGQFVLVDELGEEWRAGQCTREEVDDDA